MNLIEAHAKAQRVVAWLAPYCLRIEIAGSIRRQRPIVNDVDLVCIPHCDSPVDLFGEKVAVKNLAWEALAAHVREHPNRCRILSGIQPDAELISITNGDFQLDVFFADEQTWPSILMCRTGSKEHNIWLAQRALDRGLHWTPNKGLIRPGLPQTPEHPARPTALLPSVSEAGIYGSLGLHFIEPQHRELPWLTKNIDSGLQ